MWGDFIEVIVVLRAVVDCERAASGRFYIHMKPRFRSEKSGAEAGFQMDMEAGSGGPLTINHGPQHIQSLIHNSPSSHYK